MDCDIEKSRAKLDENICTSEDVHDCNKSYLQINKGATGKFE